MCGFQQTLWFPVSLQTTTLIHVMHIHLYCCFQQQQYCWFPYSLCMFTQVFPSKESTPTMQRTFPSLLVNLKQLCISLKCSLITIIYRNQKTTHNLHFSQSTNNNRSWRLCERSLYVIHLSRAFISGSVNGTPLKGWKFNLHKVPSLASSID